MTAEPILVGNRYQLGETLGRGGMAEVRRAIDTRLGRPVAVKQLRSDLATDPTFQARFRREAQSAAGLNHPTIVAVYDTGEEPDPVTGASVPYIVMELVEGQTLRDVLRDGRKILPERALELTQGVLDALGYSHKAGIVHRDIKPANVMLTPAGDVKVMDFGIARAVADTSATMTQTAAVIGTAQYLSPEQARGETVDNRSDIYSAGCLLYELLVGRPPFTGESPVSVAYQHVREMPVPPSELDPMITPQIDAITLKALAKDPADRYQNAREMKNDIARLLAGQQVTAVVPPLVEPEPAPTVTRVVPAPAANPPVASAASAAEPEEAGPARHIGRGILVTVLVLALLGGLAYGGYRFLNQQPRQAPVAQVTVPNVVGNTKEQATNQLKNINLAVKVKDFRGKEDGSVGEVINQAPTENTMVDPNSTVTIEVNVGPKQATIPKGLTGESRQDVETQLKVVGFTDISAEVDPNEPKDAQQDEVTGVSPAEGSTVSLDTAITLRYATGKSEIPNWNGLTKELVQASANDKGFTKINFKEKESSNPEGTVIAQDPEPFTKVDRDSKITVTLAKKQQEASSPTPSPPSNTPSKAPSKAPSKTPSKTPSASATSSDTPTG